MMQDPVNLNLLDEIMAHMMGRGVGYKLGAKAPSLGCDTLAIEQIDCSGFVRYVIARCSGVIVPDGSQNQLDWARGNLNPSSYKYAAHGEGLYICFITPHIGKEWPRHVWLMRQGYTRESCGSQGVTERPYNTPILIDNVSATFDLPCAKE